MNSPNVSPLLKIKHDPDNNLIELVEVLQTINPDSGMAALNAVSISDNNGGRISL